MRESVRARPIVKAEPVQTALAQREERALMRGYFGGVLVRRDQSEALLRSQYYFLKALAAKLDGGVASAEEERIFWAGLAQYKAHGERLQNFDSSRMLIAPSRVAFLPS